VPAHRNLERKEVKKREKKKERGEERERRREWEENEGERRNAHREKERKSKRKDKKFSLLSRTEPVKEMALMFGSELKSSESSGRHGRTEKAKGERGRGSFVETLSLPMFLSFFHSLFPFVYFSRVRCSFLYLFLPLSLVLFFFFLYLRQEERSLRESHPRS
jgi:hypothetical protein